MTEVELFCRIKRQEFEMGVGRSRKKGLPQQSQALCTREDRRKNILLNGPGEVRCLRGILKSFAVG